MPRPSLYLLGVRSRCRASGRLPYIRNGSDYYQLPIRPRKRCAMNIRGAARVRPGQEIHEYARFSFARLRSFIPVSILFGQVVYNSVPSRIVGQAVLQQTTQPTATAINLVEGRELNSPQAVAVDTSVSPPILYVADTVNNRVLAWKDATGFKNGAFADLVIGQPDMYSTGPQGPGFAIEAGFVSPVAVAVDSSGRSLRRRCRPQPNSEVPAAIQSDAGCAHTGCGDWPDRSVGRQSESGGTRCRRPLRFAWQRAEAFSCRD